VLIFYLLCWTGGVSAFPRVVAYVNQYGVQMSSSTKYNTLILAFIYLGPNYTAKLGGAIQGWQTPTTVSTIGLADFLMVPNNQVFLSVGGADWGSNSWQSLIGNEDTFVQNLINLASNITSPDSSGKIHKINIAGIDFDYEDNNGIYPPGKQYNGVQLLINLSKAVKARGLLVSHAPQAPYLCTPSEDSNPNYGECSPGIGGYLDVMQQGGSYIDFLNIQYYNNPSFNNIAQLFDNYNGLKNGFSYKGSFLQIPERKLLVGKPNQPNDAGSGYIPVNQLVSQVFCPLYQQSSSFGGAMTWEYHDDSWGSAVTSGLQSC